MIIVSAAGEVRYISDHSQAALAVCLPSYTARSRKLPVELIETLWTKNPSASPKRRSVSPPHVIDSAGGRLRLVSCSIVDGDEYAISIDWKQTQDSGQPSVDYRLTHRERQVAAMLAQGFIAKEVATQLGISPLTVKTHLQRLRRKTKARNLVQAVLRALRP